MKAWRWALLVGLCIAHASWADETFSGYLKNFSLVQFEQTNGDIEIPRQAVQESSLRLMWEPKGLDWSTEFHYEVQDADTERTETEYDCSNCDDDDDDDVDNFESV